MDDPSVLAVHSLLDSQVLTQSEAVNSSDDSDIFQCGKCKKQFTSITSFISHKKEICGSSSNGIAISVHQSTPVIPQNAVLVRKIQVPSSPLPGYRQNVILTEADLLPLSTASVDQNPAISVASCANIQTSSISTIVSPNLSNSHSLSTTLQHVFPKVHTISALNAAEPSSNAVSLLNSKLLSGQLLLVGQPDSNSAISGVVLNIANPAVAPAEDQVNTEQQVEISEPHESAAREENEADALPEENEETELSTVNVIAEFHSTMVKTRKQNTQVESEDEANKKEHKLNCAYCSKSFTKNFDLQQHIRCHTGEKPFQCIVCGRAFAQKSNVKKHMQTHKVWPDGLSNTLPKFSRNQSSGSEDGKLESQGNDLSSDALDNDKEESRTEGDVAGNSYACPYCLYIGKTYYNLKSHMKQHEMKKVYKCIINTCALMFEELDPFLEHTRSHENEMTYQCHECNKNFASLYELGSHQYTHSLYPNKHSRSSRKLFRCTLCLNKYSTPAALNHHIATSTHMYSCLHCDKVFPCERYLRRHLRIHAGSESFICKLCNKGFRTENYLKVHMLTHSASKPFACNLCKAAFNRKDKLKRHLLIHEPVKRYKCPFRSHIGCIKEFNRPDKLKAHILTHTCLKPLVCRTCGQTFQHMTQLREHVQAHKAYGDALEECKCCGEKFPSEKEALKHQCQHLLSAQRKSKPSQKCQGSRQRTLKDVSLLPRKSGNANSRHKNRSKRQAKYGEKRAKTDGEELEVLDGIPTAHIEIISTSGELVASVHSMSDFPLPSNFESDNVQEQFEEVMQHGVPQDHVDNCDTSTFCAINLHPSNSSYEECNTLQEAM